jgi:hypothetical protein
MLKVLSLASPLAFFCIAPLSFEYWKYYPSLPCTLLALCAAFPVDISIIIQEIIIFSDHYHCSYPPQDGISPVLIKLEPHVGHNISLPVDKPN